MRLIDADAYEHAVQGNPYVSDSVKRYVMCSIQSQPTIDAVQVIRCKDCKLNPKRMWVGCPMAGCMSRNDDSFCSVGKRRKKKDDR